ncbi:hypothetical protein [Moorena producens]|uniref:hypothetical protein n=1 Tax=Moorena producens TaxID=1155739 RepID=UPI003C7535EB
MNSRFDTPKYKLKVWCQPALQAVMYKGFILMCAFMIGLTAVSSSAYAYFSSDDSDICYLEHDVECRPKLMGFTPGAADEMFIFNYADASDDINVTLYMYHVPTKYLQKTEVYIENFVIPKSWDEMAGKIYDMKQNPPTVSIAPGDAVNYQLVIPKGGLTVIQINYGSALVIHALNETQIAQENLYQQDIKLHILEFLKVLTTKQMTKFL